MGTYSFFASAISGVEIADSFVHTAQIVISGIPESLQPASGFKTKKRPIC